MFLNVSYLFVILLQYFRCCLSPYCTYVGVFKCIIFICHIAAVLQEARSMTGERYLKDNFPKFVLLLGTTSFSYYHKFTQAECLFIIFIIPGHFAWWAWWVKRYKNGMLRRQYKTAQKVKRLVNLAVYQPFNFLWWVKQLFVCIYGTNFRFSAFKTTDGCALGIWWIIWAALRWTFFGRIPWKYIFSRTLGGRDFILFSRFTCLSLMLFSSPECSNLSCHQLSLLDNLVLSQL